MLRQPPSQPQSPHQLGMGQQYNPFDSLPTSSRHSHDTPGWPPQHTSRMPQHYAHPLTRHNSYPIPTAHQGPDSSSSRHSEHMLRRKTPNGVLPAAYDSSGDDALLQQPTKHILLPVTADQTPTSVSRAAYFGKHDLPLRASSFDRHLPGTNHQKSHYGTHDSEFKSRPHHLPQIDSMLNQIPAHYPQLTFQPGGGQQFFGAVQQPLPSPLGPTVSNEQLSYGPYWPNGTFLPYQPAEKRDPRFMPPVQASWMPQSLGTYPHGGLRDWQNGATPGLTGLQGFNSGHVTPVAAPLDFSNTGLLADQPFVRAFPPNAHQNRPPHPSVISPAPSSDPFSSAFGFHQSAESSGHSTPHAYTSSPIPFQDLNSNSRNSEVRERIFTWAHGIYVDFLEHLHKHRKILLQQKQLHGIKEPVRPSIYPKPPRQPLFSSATAQESRKQSETVTRHQNQSFGTNDLSRNGLGRSQSLRSANPPPFLHNDPHRRLSWQQQPTQSMLSHRQQPAPNPYRTLRRTSGHSVANAMPQSHVPSDVSPTNSANQALDALTKVCNDNDWRWVEGLLLAGCFAYCLGDYEKAFQFYSKILNLEPNHVEAIANLAATYLAIDRHQEAEEHWLRAIKIRPNYFDAVEHLIGLLCSRQRGKEAAQVIEFVERSLHLPKHNETRSAPSSCSGRSPSLSEASDHPVFDFDSEKEISCGDLRDYPGSDQPGFGTSGFAVPGFENGRVVGLLHAKGNMLYSLGDNTGAAKAFESAVLVAVGRRIKSIKGLIDLILYAFTDDDQPTIKGHRSPPAADPILLGPDRAVQTALLCFPPNGDLPGFRDLVLDPVMRKAAVTTTSNSLLSLAKIFQDGMASNSPQAAAFQSVYGVREILALYYLSLALQPSPSTANNVGILLAGLQQTVPQRMAKHNAHLEPPPISGVTHGSGTHLALHYYNYGLNLDSRHAHLYTNLGSLLKDIGQLNAAIKMYEQAVACDGGFDIALANLANAVKDQGRISDAIKYYKDAVQANPNFAEAVCGLANARNSVCDWTGRGGIADDRGRRDRFHVTEEGKLIDARTPDMVSTGWLKGVVDLVEKQLTEGEEWGRGAFDGGFIAAMVQLLTVTDAGTEGTLSEKKSNMIKTLTTWSRSKWAGARMIRLVERAIRRLGWQWYQDKYVRGHERSTATYARPILPSGLTVPATPTVLPFHTFTSPMSSKQIRLISQRNGLRISTMTLKAAWLPPVVFPPPPPPTTYLKIGYVSSDFNNHPLAHLMQSVFGMHNPKRIRAYCYATTPSDHSSHRHQIEREAPVFHDASSWSAERLVKQIVNDGIHILVNLNGYTRGARNEVFAARPAPIQMSFMGFAGTLGAEWCDYLLADETAVPLDTLRPWRRNVDLEDQMVDENSSSDNSDWVYGENIIFCRHSFFCCDHRQSAPDAKSVSEDLSWEDEQLRRWHMRKELFPHLSDDCIILGNFNQLYKIEPTTFRTWLRILSQVPNAILWLLRFPELGESNLKKTALAWAGPEVASRVIFTDVAPKQLHISRARICDLFLDTPECNAHTTAADVLWSGTPLLTLPRYHYKMCARVAASVLRGALPLETEQGRTAADELIAANEDEYEARAVQLARSCRYEGHRPTGRLAQLRKLLYESRWTSTLFDTKRWTRDLEEAYEVAWARWVRGEGGDIWIDGNGSGRRPRMGRMA